MSKLCEVKVVGERFPYHPLNPIVSGLLREEPIFYPQRIVFNEIMNIWDDEGMRNQHTDITLKTIFPRHTQGKVLRTENAGTHYHLHKYQKLATQKYLTYIQHLGNF